MIKIINNSEILNLNEASNKYKGYTYLMTLVPGKDNSYTTGKVRAICDQDSVGELIDLENKLKAKGEDVLIGEGDDDEDFEDLEIVGYKVYG